MSFLPLLHITTLILHDRYATAIFTAYIQNKLQKGRSRFEVSLKVQDLERGVRPTFPPSSFPRSRYHSSRTSSTRSPKHAAQQASLPLRSSPTQQPPPRDRHRNSVYYARNRPTMLRTTTTRPAAAPRPGCDAPQQQRCVLLQPPVQHQRPFVYRKRRRNPLPRHTAVPVSHPSFPFSHLADLPADPEPEATAVLNREMSRLSTSGALPLPTSPTAPQRPSETADDRAERERREFEEALRLSRESAEEEEALRLSRESAEAEAAARLAREAEESFGTSSSGQSLSQSVPGGYPSTSTTAPPPLPPRSGPSLMDDGPAPGLAAPLQPIATGSNNPFASALDPIPSAQNNDPQSTAPEQQRYAPPPGPPPGHVASQSQQTYTPPAGPPPGHSRNPFADPSSFPSQTQPPPTNTTTTHLHDLSFLARYDTLLLIDDSGSMSGSRWTQVRTALMDVVQRIVAAQEAGGKDADGVEIAFLNSAVEGFNLTVSSPCSSVRVSWSPSRAHLWVGISRERKGARMGREVERDVSLAKRTSVEQWRGGGSDERIGIGMILERQEGVSRFMQGVLWSS